MLLNAGLVGSKGEARRLIRGGGARVNDVAIGDETQTVTVSDITAEGVIKLSAGKRNTFWPRRSSGLLKMGRI